MKHLPDEGREQFWENTLDLIADWLESGAINKMIPKKDEFLIKTYDVIQSQSTELKEKEKRIAQLEEALKRAKESNDDDNEPDINYDLHEGRGEDNYLL